MANSAELSTFHLLSRITASIAGGYCFVFGVISMGTALGVRLGMPFTEALTWMYFLAFLIYTTVFCWAFIHRSLLVVWLVLMGGGSAMTALGWWLGNSV